MHIFYTPDVLATGEMPEDESNHAVKVLRLTEGEEVTLVDGKGTFYDAVITRAHHKRCAVEIRHERNEGTGRDFEVHIAVAPTKNIDRIEWFTEKSTEIGIDRIIPLKCRFSERKEIKNERLTKILVSAMKQSLKASLPVLETMTNFRDFVSSEFEGEKFIAHCYKDTERILLKNAYTPGKNALVLIGPEGDFSEEEVEMAIEAGFKPISLGNSRLRTETAALVACHTVNFINE